MSQEGGGDDYYDNFFGKMKVIMGMLPWQLFA